MELPSVGAFPTNGSPLPMLHLYLALS